MEDDMLIAAIISAVVPVVVEASIEYALDGRLFRRDNSNSQTVYHDFWPEMKRKRDKDRFRQTLRCEPDAFDHIVNIITPV